MQKQIKTLLSKLSPTAAQMAKYAVVAAIGLVVDFGLLIFSKEVLGFHYLIAVTVGFIFGLVVNYYLSNKFVFVAPKANPKTVFILFGLIGVVGLVLLDTMVWLLTGKLEVSYLASKSLGTIVVFLWNFFARKTLFQ